MSGSSKPNAPLCLRMTDEGRGILLGVSGRSRGATDEASENAGEAGRAAPGPYERDMLDETDRRDEGRAKPIADVRPERGFDVEAESTSRSPTGLTEGFHRGRLSRVTLDTGETGLRG